MRTERESGDFEGKNWLLSFLKKQSSILSNFSN